MGSKVVLVFLDAFSSRYLNQDYCPFLSQFCQKGYFHSIEPLFAFEGIGATIFSGTYPRTNQVWTNFIRKKDTEVDPPFYKLFQLSSFIPNDRLASDLRYLLYKFSKKPPPIPNLIPYKMLKFFEHKLEKPIFSPNALDNIPTLFDVLRSQSLSVTTFLPSSFFLSDEMIAKTAKSYFKKGDLFDLTYLKFADLDMIGHNFGPFSKETKNAVKKIDLLLKSIIEEALNVKENITFLIFSDHGMSQVKKAMNVERLLMNVKLKIGVDFIFFLDSTMARFWANDQHSLTTIKDKLAKLNVGKFLSDEDLQKLKLPTDRDLHGELIYALDEGYLIYPDFFHRKSPIKGMHGYHRSKFDFPVFAMISSGSIQLCESMPIEFTDIMPTILKLLGAPIPPTCEGAPLI